MVLINPLQHPGRVWSRTAFIGSSPRRYALSKSHPDLRKGVMANHNFITPSISGSWMMLLVLASTRRCSCSKCRCCWFVIFRFFFSHTAQRSFPTTPSFSSNRGWFFSSRFFERNSHHDNVCGWKDAQVKAKQNPPHSLFEPLHSGKPRAWENLGSIRVDMHTPYSVLCSPSSRSGPTRGTVVKGGEENSRM